MMYKVKDDSKIRIMEFNDVQISIKTSIFHEIFYINYLHILHCVVL